MTSFGPVLYESQNNSKFDDVVHGTVSHKRKHPSDEIVLEYIRKHTESSESSFIIDNVFNYNHHEQLKQLFISKR